MLGASWGPGNKWLGDKGAPRQLSFLKEESQRNKPGNPISVRFLQVDRPERPLLPQGWRPEGIRPQSGAPQGPSA